MFYHGEIKDAPTTQTSRHPLTSAMIGFMNELFRSCISNKPYRYLDVRGLPEVMDEASKSWVNLSTAAIVVNIIKKGVHAGIFKAQDIPHITHYTAQQKVINHAMTALALEFPDLSFGNHKSGTTHAFQGDEGPIVICDPVRTTMPGFTGDAGRTCVSLTRATDFQLTIADHHWMSKDKPNYMVACFDAARQHNACLTIKKDGDHEDLFHHCYVSARPEFHV